MRKTFTIGKKPGMVSVLIGMLLIASASVGWGQNVVIDFSDEALWGGGAAGSYNAKTYTQGGWFFTDGDAIRETDAARRIGTYSWRVRGQDGENPWVATNTTAATYEGFIIKVRPWSTTEPGSLHSYTLSVSADGGDSWTIVQEDIVGVEPLDWITIDYSFDEKEFEIGDFVVVLARQGTLSGNSRLNVGEFTAVVPLGDQPLISASVTSLGNLNYLFETGPSDSKSFEVDGINLDPESGDISVNGTISFEVSLDNSDFGDSRPIAYTNGELGATTVYVRLKEGLSVDSYEEQVTLSGGGADPVMVTLAGNVYEPFAIPYFNGLRTQSDYDLATAQGFVFVDADLATAAGGRIDISPDGYIETPEINFTEFNSLLVKFDLRNFGSGSDRELSVLISGQELAWTVLEVIPINSTTDVTFDVVVDLTEEYNVENGKFRFVMSDGTGGIRFRDLSIGFVPVANPTFDPEGGSFYSPITVAIETATENATIYYSLESAEGPWMEYTVGLDVDETTTIWAYAEKVDMPDSEVVSETYTFYSIVEVDDIAGLRDMWGAKPDVAVYKITGEVVLTLQADFRNHKYIQDDSGAILIDDPTGVITTLYNLGDGITGITGTLNAHQNMLQFVPVADPGVATDTGLEITPLVTTLDNLLPTNQAQLVTIYGVSFSDVGNFGSPVSYDISDVSGNGVLRTHYSDLNYVGTAIPEGAHITGVILQFGEILQIVPRNMDDFFKTYFDFAVNPPAVEVVFGTDLAGALAALPTTTTITDDLGNVYEVEIVDWVITDYDGQTPGSYLATGVLVLPPWIEDQMPEKDNGPIVTTQVVVLDEPVAIPLSNWSLFLVMAGMLGTAVWMIRRSWA